MIFFHKVGMLILNEDQTKFLVCQLHPSHVTDNYLMPGGVREKGESDIECLKREIMEELACEVDVDSLNFIGKYVDIAASMPSHEVEILLYHGNIIGLPEPSSEIYNLEWIGKEAVDHPLTGPAIKNKIIPDLVKRGILK